MPPPRSSTKEISNKLLELFSNVDNLIFCAYKELGFLCFDGSELSLVSVLPPTKEQAAPAFVKTSVIALEQTPPGIDAVGELRPSPNGRYVAMIGERCIFIVEMSTDLWNNQSLFTSICLENLRKRYVVRRFSCEVLNVKMLLSKRVSSIRKVSWLSSKHTRTEFSTNILGVLYSNSIVRIYDLNASKSSPIALVDFQRILLGYEPEESFKSTDGKQLGLISEMTTFDFGPLQAFFSIFAVDSDGEVYYSVCGTKANNQLSPIGPLSIAGKDSRQKSFYFNSTEIYYVDHPHSNKLRVFAFCSEQGELFHTVLYQTEPLDALFKNNKNIFKLTALDSLQIEDWPLKNMNVAIRANVDFPGEYFIITSTEVYLISPLKWINKILSCISDRKTNSKDLPVSDVRHFFKVVNTGTETNTIVSIASLRVEDDSSEFAKLSLFAVLDSVPRLNAHFVQRQIAKQDDGKFKRKEILASELKTNNLLNLKVPTFEVLPKLSTESLDHPHRLKLITNALKLLNEQSKKLNVHSADVHQKGKIMSDRFDALDVYYEQYCDRLVQIFEDLNKNKKQLTSMIETNQRLEKQYDSLVTKIQSRVSAPVEKEDEAAADLAETSKKCSNLADRLRELSKRIELRTKETKPFRASKSAQKFMLSKNSAEIAHLGVLVQNLKKDAAFLPKEKSSK
ncbi:hypothetical protein M3Y97_00698300 [Aphelenchoides bicaudatus]|nr:hypothetical protein M3Y97_00698300 [Aphelenchoides bicaudatus]